jgi:hypothetical protein
MGLSYQINMFAKLNLLNMVYLYNGVFNLRIRGENNMKKKRIWLFIAMITVLSLVACGKSEESSTQIVEETNSKSSGENSEEDKDVFESSSSKEEEVQPSENLLDKNKEFKYEDGSVVMTLTKAEFTKKFGASNADPEDTWANHEITTDSEIYLHLTGTIKNDTTDLFSFGNKLGEINFSLLYDGKHTFENTSSAEEENGTKLGASSIDALTEGNIHVYFQVPKTVSESDKPLVLTVTLGEEPFEIQLR